MNILKKVLLITFLSLMCLNVNAKDPWTKEQRIKQGVVIALSLTDMFQTLEYRDTNYVRHEEGNPLLGNRPKDSTVISYFAGCILAHVMISDLLPDKFRNYWLNASISFEAVIVGRNHALGVRIKW